MYTVFYVIHTHIHLPEAGVEHEEHEEEGHEAGEDVRSDVEIGPLGIERVVCTGVM
jgi:hypothetical protein